MPPLVVFKASLFSGLCWHRFWHGINLGYCVCARGAQDKDTDHFLGSDLFGTNHTGRLVKSRILGFCPFTTWTSAFGTSEFGLETPVWQWRGSGDSAYTQVQSMLEEQAVNHHQTTAHPTQSKALCLSRASQEWQEDKGSTEWLTLVTTRCARGGCFVGPKRSWLILVSGQSHFSSWVEIFLFSFPYRSL